MASTGPFVALARAHWRLLGLFIGVSSAGAVAKCLEPIALAPALDAALAPGAAPAPSFAAVTLNNLGPTLGGWLNLSSGGSRLRVVVASAALYAVAASVAAGLAFFADRLLRRIRNALFADILSTLHKHVLAQPLRFFQARRQGDLASRFIWDVALAAESADLVLRNLCEAGPLLLIYGIVLVRTDPWLTSAVGFLTLLHVCITRVLQHEIARRATAASDEHADLEARIQETLSAIRVIKSFSAERVEEESFRNDLVRHVDAMLRHHLHADAEGPLRAAVNALAAAAVVIISFSALMTGRLTLAGFVLFVYIARQAMVPLSHLGRAVVQVHAVRGASKRVSEILETSSALRDGPLEAEPLQSCIALHDVSFSYAPGVPVLRDVHFYVQRATTVALVGSSGSGKSTILDLLLRLHDPASGSITYDGRDLRDFSQQSYRRRFGVVPQDPMLFNTTIERNIAYGRPLISECIEDAARMANALEFVRRMPQGFRTLVGDRGVRLSGGERQRIALARALYGKPEILLLDEATSSLDSESERVIQAAIERALEGTTAVIVAHRLSTVLRAHTIVVVEDGRIHGVGTHAELLECNPVYRRLCQAQFGALSASGSARSRDQA